VAASNGKQHHPTAREIVQRQRERSLQPFHSTWLDMDFLIRARTGAEIAHLSDESTRLQADIEQYAGTADAPPSVEQLRVGLRSAIPVLLDPETKEPRFGLDEVDDLVELPMPVINELLGRVNEVANFTQAQADDAAKNSEATDENRPSSASPSPAETSMSSPTPIR
jgi:hypothetical protein